MYMVLQKREGVEQIKKILSEVSIDPSEAAKFLEERDSAPLYQKQKAIQLLLRPNISLPLMIKNISSLGQKFTSLSPHIIEQAEIQIKYDTYIEKEKEIVQRMSQLENLTIPENFDYDRISSLSTEAQQKFKKLRPRTLGQASRISGVNPSDVQILMVYMGR